MTIAVGSVAWSASRTGCYGGAVRLSGLRLLTILLLALTVAPAWAHGPRLPEPRPNLAEVVVTPSEPARSPDPVERLQLTPGQVSFRRSGVAMAEVAGALIVVLGLTACGRFWHRDRRMALSAATVALALGFVVETTPHLVHHTLDTDQGASCQALQSAERSQGAVGNPDVTPVPAPVYLAAVPLRVTAPTLVRPACRGRAPPA
jgi:hypothetical protein